MKLDAAAKPAQDVFGGRFFLIGYLPAYAAALFLLVLVWAGAPGQLRFSKAWKTAAALSVGEILLLIVAITLAGLVTQPLQLGLVRLLEGYWPDRLDRLGEPLRRRQRDRRDSLAKTADLPERPQELTRAELNRRGRAGTELRRRYPAADQVLGTAFGNALAAAESRAGAMYGWDAVVAWPRLYPVLGDRTREVVSARRDLMDAMARLAAVSVLTGVVAAALLVRSGWWFWLALVPLLLGRLAYRAAVEAALAFGEAMETAFDLHRFDLLAALHLPPPDDVEQERRLARGLCTMWREGTEPPPVGYAHPDPCPPCGGRA